MKRDLSLSTRVGAGYDLDTKADMPALVSLLSPIRDEADYLPAMIRSVQAQTYPHWELVFVDDGSSDASMALIEHYASDDSRIRLLTNVPPFGKISAFNIAFAASCGDIIALLAGDDLLPINSLAIRIGAFEFVDGDSPAVAFFKIRTFADDRKFDGMILPRGSDVSRSGGSITMNRALADQVFPIPEELVAEDVWLAYSAMDLARHVIQVPSVILFYRIHAGNSNPRALSFRNMSIATRARNRAWWSLLNLRASDLREETKQELAALWRAEELRFRGRILPLIFLRGLSWPDKFAMVSKSRPSLFAIRSYFYRFFSGRRGA